jgi:hypothetical protein
LSKIGEHIVAGEVSLAKTAQVQFLEYLKQTPKALAVLIMSYFSGQLWVFIIAAFLRSKTRGNKLLQSTAGKTAVGLLWFSGILAPVYWLKFGNLGFEYAGILEVAIPTLVSGMFAQLVVFALFVALGDRV